MTVRKILDQGQRIEVEEGDWYFAVDPVYVGQIQVGDHISIDHTTGYVVPMDMIAAAQDHSQDGWYYNDTIKHPQWEHWVGGSQIDHCDDGSIRGGWLEKGAHGLVIVPKPGTTSTVAAPAGMSRLSGAFPQFVFNLPGGCAIKDPEPDKPKPIPWTDCSMCGKKATLSPNQPSDNLLNFRCTNMLGCGEVTARRKDSRHIYDYVPEED